jgi:hypothetical protein
MSGCTRVNQEWNDGLDAVERGRGDMRGSRNISNLDVAQPLADPTDAVRT